LSEERFHTKAFKSLLHDYETQVRNGESVFLDEDDFMDVIEYYGSIQQMDKALQAIDYALTLYPGSAMALAFKARAVMTTDHDTQKAKAYADEIADQSDPECLLLRAEIMLNEQKGDDADAYLRKCANEMEDDEKEDFILDVVLLFSDYNQMDLAAKWLKHSHYTKDADYQEAKARIMISRGDYEGSKKILNKLLDKDSFSADYWNYLASAQLLQGRHAETLSSCDYALAIEPNNLDALFNKSKPRRPIPRPQKALEGPRHIKQIVPNDPSAELVIGMCLMDMNKLDKAYDHFHNAYEMALRSKDNNIVVSALEQMTYLNCQFGKKKEALRVLDEANDMRRNIGLESNLVLRGFVYLSFGDLKEASDSFRKAVIFAENYTETIVTIASMVVDCGYYNIAYSLFRTVLLSSGDNEIKAGWGYYARCCYELDKPQEYQMALKQAIENCPDEAKSILSDLYPEGTDVKDYADTPTLDDINKL